MNINDLILWGLGYEMFYGELQDEIYVEEILEEEIWDNDNKIFQDNKINGDN
jgi:hypothetical protein